MNLAVKRVNLHSYAIAIVIFIGAVGFAQKDSQAATISVPATQPSYGSGFTSTGLTLNGGATVSGSKLVLTDGRTGEARSAFFTTPVDITGFTNTFTFQDMNASADGLCFVIEASGPTAVGGGGGNLGYAGSTGPLSTKSLCVSFDLYSNKTYSEISNTGLFTNGASAAGGAGSSTGFSFQSGHVFSVTMSYSGTTLAMTLTDTVTKATYSTSFTVNIPTLVGGNTAYVGFTGSTGGLAATQDILSWNYLSSASPATTPRITTSSLPAGAVSVSYNAGLSVNNGVPPYTWSVIGGQLPPGLSLQTSSGLITGVPSQAGTFSFSVQVKDSRSQTSSVNFSTNIAPAGSPVIKSFSPTSGPTSGGTTTAINGSNFVAGASVTFGGVSASSVSVVSSSQIQAVTPAHVAGGVGLMVSTAGESSTAGSNFTYEALNNDPPPGQGLLSGCTVSSSNTVNYGSNGCPSSVPSGWTFVLAEGFDSGSLRSSSEYAQTNVGITEGMPHTGSHSLQCNVNFDGDECDLGIIRGTIGSSNHIYVSYWRHMDPNACSGVETYFDDVYTGNRTQFFDVMDTQGAAGSCNTSASAAMLGDGTPFAIYSNYKYPLGLGTWQQIEFEFQGSTCSGSTSNKDGLYRLWINGVLEVQNVGANLNGCNPGYSSAGMAIEAGGTFTYLASNGTTNIAPPNGAFNVYMDDVIVIKK